jgi:hypothetical protein
MLSATYNEALSIQNYPKLLEFVQIYLKPINLRNFEIPPKIEILVFFKKNHFLFKGSTKACLLLGFLIQEFFACQFNGTKRSLCINISIPLCAK